MIRKGSLFLLCRLCLLNTENAVEGCDATPLHKVMGLATKKLIHGLFRNFYRHTGHLFNLLVAAQNIPQVMITLSLQ